MDINTPSLRAVRTPLRLTLLGLWAERIAHAFWPLWSVCLVALTVQGFGALDSLPLEGAWFSVLMFAGALVFGIWYAARHFQRPSLSQAVARLDATLLGQPLAALSDAQAINAEDQGSSAVWAAHKARMQARLSGAVAVAPDLRLSARDPYALRYIAALGACLALIFGAPDRLGNLPPLTSTAASGPTWEAWATPPAYTGKPALYLNEQPAGPLALPTGTRLQTRLYGAVGDMILDETVSGRRDAVAASEPAQDFTVTRSGELSISGRDGRTWSVTAIPDLPPSVTVDPTMERDANGRFTQGFSARDDYGVTKGQVTIALDLGAVDRRHGLATQPDPITPTTRDLPLRGSRAQIKGAEVKGSLTDDLSQSILSNLPVTVIYSVTDAAGQSGQSDPVQVTLPGRRFFDPLAAALVEMRRDILWARANAPRAVQILKAVSNAPEGFIRNQSAYLRLRVAIKRLDTADVTTALRDEVAGELWDIALLVEEGDLQSAKERLARAQDRLNEAIRNGASDAEIQALMDEMRDATKQYLKQLGSEAEKRGDQTSQNNGPSLSQDQLQQMLDKLQELMEQGKTAEATALMEQLRQFMENMQVAEGGGSGDSPSDQTMQGLNDTLRDQQGLSDDAYRDLQDGQNSEGGKSLAQRQQDLRDRLDQLGQNESLPGQSTESGESGRQNLDEAGRAMQDAEEALRQGDTSGALDRQAQALEALRNGIGDLNDALAEEEQANNGPSGEQGQDDPNGQDPLGRRTGKALRNGSDENLLQGEDVYRRADELLGEIRKRAGDLTRPENERSYLKRLLDLF